jgi:hypothetical protein
MSDLLDLRTRRLFLAAPLYSGMLHFGFHKSLCDLMLACHRAGVFLGMKSVFDSLVPRARNRLALHFLDSDCTDLLFVDSDIAFRAEDALSLLARPEPILGGIYSRKQVDWGRIARAVRAGIPPESLAPFGTVPVLNWLGPADGINLASPFPVRQIGTGFLRIHREVLCAMIERFGDDIAFDNAGDEPLFSGRAAYDFFPSGIDRRHPLGSGKRQYLSEDWAFCERATELGYTIHAAPWVRLVHTGPYDYVNDLAALDRPGGVSVVPANADAGTDAATEVLL